MKDNRYTNPQYDDSATFPAVCLTLIVAGLVGWFAAIMLLTEESLPITTRTQGQVQR